MQLLQRNSVKRTLRWKVSQKNPIPLAVDKNIEECVKQLLSKEKFKCYSILIKVIKKREKNLPFGIKTVPNT